jgi:membrane protein YqaA with SNARE-associated domain
VKAIKLILAKYIAFIAGVLAPLGIWGVFAIGLIDSALFGMPLDAVVAGYVYLNHGLAWAYVLMAAAGSTLGNLLLYVIGYKGGEALLEKRMSPLRFQKMHRSFERNRLLALMVPAMMPPGFPFKLFVLSAAAFEMNLWHFLAAIFAGRLVRFTVLAALTVQFGPQIVALTGSVLRQHLGLMILALAAVTVLWLVLRRRRRNEDLAELAD